MTAVLLISEIFLFDITFDVKSPDNGIAGRGQDRLNIDIHPFIVVI